MLFLGTTAGGGDPSPWNAVTITTAVIASLGFVISLWNAWSSWRKDHPKIVWRHVWDEGGPNYRVDGGGLRFELTNRGAGTAQDVRIAAHGFDPVSVPLMEFNHSKSFWFTIGESIEDTFLIERIHDGHYFPYDADAELSNDWTEAAVTVSWSQLPNLHERKSEMFTIKRPAFEQDRVAANQG